MQCGSCQFDPSECGKARARISENAKALAKLESLPEAIATHRTLLQNIANQVSKLTQAVATIQAWQGDARNREIEFLRTEIAKRDCAQLDVVHSRVELRAKLLAAAVGALLALAGELLLRGCHAL